METKEAIKKEIEELKSQLDNVEGTQTEIYSRIVGYYRSVKNWNKGKKEEFRYRKQFNKLDGASCCDATYGDSMTTCDCADESEQYIYFYRTTCPNCPPVKSLLDEVELNGKEVNVDTPEGLELAKEYSVMSAPTVVFLDSNSNELYRTNNRQELEVFFKQIG
ncbi:MAG: thiol reductase thioredoxin [Spirochaetales bacterium]|nr:thiol reductase thioredoxin [Spirochaetales bacterium]